VFLIEIDPNEGSGIVPEDWVVSWPIPASIRRRAAARP
jgi:hypothetical protein